MSNKPVKNTLTSNLHPQLRASAIQKGQSVARDVNHGVIDEHLVELISHRYEGEAYRFFWIGFAAIWKRPEIPEQVADQWERIIRGE